MAGLLPFAIAWHVAYLVALASALVVATVLGLATHLARGREPEHPGSPPRVRTSPRARTQAQAARQRSKLPGAGTRPAAHRPGNVAPSRFDSYPILRDRVAPLRSELLEIATALEQASDPDPTSVALIHELLRDGCSPLYNPSLPATDLQFILRHARSGLHTQM